MEIEFPTIYYYDTIHASLPAPDNISDSENLLRNPSGTFPTSPFLSLHFRVFLSLFEHELELLGRPESKDSRHASDISAVRTDPQAMERNIQVIRLSTDYCCRSECSYESISVALFLGKGGHYSTLRTGVLRLHLHVPESES